MNKVRLSNFFHVKRRFRRSVHLERDVYTENTLDGYILTVTGREMLNGLVTTLENHANSHAWTLTGPYGSGKSAFALFAAKLLGNPNSPATQQALELLKHGDASLYQRFVSIHHKGRLTRGFCPVLISGERAPLTFSLLRGLKRGLTAFNGFAIRASHPLLQELSNRLKAAENGRLPRASDITGLFEAATHQLCSSGGSGMLLVIDEMGKFLEYATQSPERGDMFILQSLAEFAARSGKSPLFFFTILHQAFEHYAERAAKSQREEWAKVQGRFEDVAFAEPTEQILSLIGNALERTTASIPKRNLAEAINLKLKPRQLDDKEFTQLLANCLPLHPTVALMIGPLFRRFAQNERSVFAFLSSGEPHGLQDFLANQLYDESVLPMFSLAELYDYLNVAFGNRLYTTYNGKKWAEIESAINRLPNPSLMTVKLIKTIGLLSVAGEVTTHLKPSKSLLRYALDDGNEGFTDEFESAVETLVKTSIVTYRRYNDAYALWEGSDIDIEAKLRKTKASLEQNVRLATHISGLTPPQNGGFAHRSPLIARRHLFQTGTLRYFDVRYTDIEGLDAALNEPLGEADGLLLYAVPANRLEVEQFIEKAKYPQIASRNEMLIAIPRSIGFLRDAVLELAGLHQITENTPELEGDATAKHELAARLIEAQRELADCLAKIFDGDSENRCNWYHKGKRLHTINSQHAKNAYLSDICDAVYCKTPIIRNELINRRKTSATITTARRKLIQAMLENEKQEKLGITGYPANMAIYLSLLWDTGIHRFVSGKWEFHPPKMPDKNRMMPTWKTIEAFLAACETTRQPIVQLYERLQAPPLGVRSGPLPILLCAALLHYKTEVALYENGSFVTALSLPVFERLLKAPEQFELKRFRMTGVRTQLFTKFLETLNQPLEMNRTDLLTVVTPLMRFIAQLPKYTLTTQTLSEEARNLRKILQNAREPDVLLFQKLPNALGFPPFDSASEAAPNALSEFFDTFQKTVNELAQAYDILLNSVEQLLISAFALKPDKETLHRQLAHRAEPLLELVIETRLTGFLIRACDGGLDFTSWLEAIATYLTKKPPKAWNDTDKAEFEFNLSKLARTFHHFEAISYEKRKHTEQPATGETIRVGITRPNQHEQERVVTLPITAEETAAQIEDEIEKVFKQFNVDKNAEFRLSVLARISQKLMQHLSE